MPHTTSLHPLRYGDAETQSSNKQKKKPKQIKKATAWRGTTALVKHGEQSKGSREAAGASKNHFSRKQNGEFNCRTSQWQPSTNILTLQTILLWGRKSLIAGPVFQVKQYLLELKELRLPLAYTHTHTKCQFKWLLLTDQAKLSKAD